MTSDLGIRKNLYPFLTITLITAFVGGMVGLERTIIPILADEKFGIVSATVTLSFIVSFGITKGIFNFVAGYLNDRFGRKKIEVLGWIVGLPVPLMLIYAPSWDWVFVANILLGVNQALAWSTAVTYTLDIVSPHQRGLASGINEFAGYLGVGMLTFITSYIGALYGVHPYPMLVGIAIAVIGLLLSLTIPESHHHAIREARSTENNSNESSLLKVFILASFKDRNLFACSQGGFVANFTDGMAWGLLPLFLKGKGLDIYHIGAVATFYPMVWAFSQLGTGFLSDKVGRKPLIVNGFLLQGAGIIGIALSTTFSSWMFFAFLFGLGKGMVYPTLIAAVSDSSPPLMRGRILGVYRFWRDWGYAYGALFSGIIADFLSPSWGIGATGIVALCSGAIVLIALRETRRKKSP
jgi:MFS family permease